MNNISLFRIQVYHRTPKVLRVVVVKRAFLFTNTREARGESKFVNFEGKNIYPVPLVGKRERAVIYSLTYTYAILMTQIFKM